MKKIFTLLTAAVLTCSAALAEGRVTLADIDFSTWEDQEICAGSTKQQTVNGITFYCDKSTDQFSVSEGVLNLTSNNMKSSNYIFGLPLTGVAKNIYVTVYDDTTDKSKTLQYNYFWVGGATEFSVKTDVSATKFDKANPVIATIVDEENTSGWLYLGRASSNYSTMTRVLVETDATNPLVDTPTFTCEDMGGIAMVEIEYDDVNSTVHYTTDGTTPTAESEEYDPSMGIEVFGNGIVIKAIAIANDQETYSDSPVAVSDVINTIPMKSVLSFQWTNPEGAEDYAPVGGNISVVVDPKTTLL